MYKTDSQWEAAIWPRELTSALCDDLGGRDAGGEGGRSRREGIHACMSLIRSDVQQKLVQYWNPIILQFKKKTESLCSILETNTTL